MATPNTPADATNSIIALLMDELRQSLEPKLLHALADYHLYKETHNAVLQIPFVKHLLETQCKCRANQLTQLPQSIDPIQLEIIDVVTEHNHALPNLDSIAEYINTTISHDDYDADDASETGHHAVEPEESDNDEKERNENENEEEAEEEEEEEEEEQEEEEAAQEAETSKEDEEEEVQDEEEEVQDEDEEEEAEEEEEEEEVEEEEVQEAETSKEEEEEEVQDAEEEEKEEVQEEVEVEAEEDEEVEAEVEKEVQDAEEEEEEELELFEVEIKGKTYVTNDETNGDIYAYVNDEVGEIVGTFKNGVAKFAKKAKSKST